MGLVENLADIVCLARKDIFGDFAISGQPYAIDWHGANITEEERRSLRNIAWRSGMSRYDEDHYLPEQIEIRWNRSGKEAPTVSYPSATDYALEIHHL